MAMAAARPCSAVCQSYVRRYCLDSGGRSGEDLCVLFHPNGLCILCIAPSHAMLGAAVAVTIDWKVTGNLPTGKRKKGGTNLRKGEALCRIKEVASRDGVGREWEVLSCVRGKLLEVNDRVCENPKLLLEKPGTEGYLAILMPFEDEYEAAKKRLMGPDEYRKKRENELKGYKGEDIEDGGVPERKRGPAFTGVKKT